MISLSSTLRWFATTYESLFIFVALFGFGGPLISIGLPKLASMWFIGKERGTASGVYTTGNTIGGMVALSITNSIVMPIVGNWKHVFLIYAIIGFLITVVWLSLGRRSPDVKTIALGSTEVEGQWHIMKRLFRRKNIWLIVGIGITYFLTIHGLSNWLPKILELKGIPPNESGVIVSSLNLFGICGSILIPKLHLYLQSKKRAIAVTLFTLSLAILVFGVTSGMSMWIGIALTWFFMRGLLPLLLVTLMDMPEIGSKHMGIVGGLYFSIGEIGGFGGPFLMGFFKDITGSFLSGIIFLVVVIQVAIVCTAYLNVDASIKS
jgi:cyanate permease